jgi:hypothetical protein
MHWHSGRRWWGGHHPSKLGHELSSDLLASWFTEQLCKAPLMDAVERITGRMELDLPIEPSLVSYLVQGLHCMLTPQ